MEYKKMYDIIKQLCKEKGITVSQLEKEQGFSVGSIGKWRQYSPSIEKVLAVARYFGISLDELCGNGDEKKQKQSKFLERLYKKTKEREIVWIPFLLSKMREIQFGLFQKEFEEVYFAEYMIEKEKIKFIIGITENEQDQIKLYISLEDGYFRQIEQEEDLKFLWEELKDQELNYTRYIEALIDKF